MCRVRSVTQPLWKCPSCTVYAAQHLRSFTTATQRQETGPESPRYIDIPEPPQKNYTPRPRIKGVLPVARDIFHKRLGGVGKVTPEYLAAVTPDAKPAAAATSDAERIRNENKRRMAERRKQNLREGLTELQTRRQRSDEITTRRTAERQRHRARLIAEPEREDERLTNPTTTLLMHTLQRSAVLPDPDRAERIAAMVERVQAKEAQRVGDRQDALHTLYMHARNFITSEAQLDEKIELAFGTNAQPVTWGNSGTSIWRSSVPESIQDKLNRANRTRGTLQDTGNQGTEITKDRIGKIAEQLTGGKMG